MNIIKGEARSRALAHVLRTLEYDNFLCQCIKRRVNFEKGFFYSVDPGGRKIEEIDNFSWGLGCGHDENIANRLNSSLSVGNHRVLILDDVMSDAVSSTDNRIIKDGQTYHWIAGRILSDEFLNKIIWEVNLAWHFLAVIFDLNRHVTPRNFVHCCNCGEIGDIIEIIVGAYDGEGFVHWAPHQL